jgi:Carboxypeptidase regulatory-like domain/TonB-dependent Receptor Plug Domain
LGGAALDLLEANVKAKALLLAGVLVLASPVSFGQNVSSSLRAVLVDPSGALIPSASCVLTNQGTAASVTTQSDSSGTCGFLSILPGTYTLRIESAGFRTLEMKEIPVTANEVRTLGNLTMTLGAVQDSVSVNDESAPIQLASAEKSGLVTGQQLERLALKGRDFFSLLPLIPGIVDTGSLSRDATAPESLGGTTINGSRDSSKNFTVDGILNMDTGSNQTVQYEPPMDTIAEVKVLTSNYQAEYGRNSGGVITVITKSGTQSFHGAGYDYYRNETLNANSWGNNRSGTLKAPYRYRISGYNIGGPAYIPGKFNQNKDKLFFFWSQEFTGIKRNYATQLANTPTDLERNGDFSLSKDATGALIPIKDPTTNVQFPGNVIPPTRINSLGQSVLNYFPKPNYTSPDPRFFYQNHRDTYSGQYDRRNDLARIDGSITPTLTFYYRFVQDHDEQSVPWGSWIVGSQNWLISPAQFGQPGHGHAAHLTKIISPTFINDFSFGKSYNRVYADLTDPGAVARSKMGNFPSWYGNAAYIPNVTFGATYPPTPINASLYAGLPYLNYTDIYVFNDNVSKNWGAHSFKTGMYVERNGKLAPVVLAYRGSLSFARNTLNPFDSNNGFSNALLGNFYSYAEGSKRLNGDWWFWNVEWYAQDNWRVSKRLTLDYGVRFYHLPAVTDNNGVMATFYPSQYSLANAPAIFRPAINPATGARMAQNPRTGEFAPATLIGAFVPNTGSTANGMVVAGQGAPDGLARTTPLDFTPRVGLAWDVFGTGKLAVHAGFGTFKDRTNILPAVNASGKPPIAYTPTAYFGNVSTLAQSTGYLSPSALTILTGRAKTPTTMNFSFGVQTMIRDTSVDVSYVGGLSRHLWINRNLNVIPMGARFVPGNIDTTTGSPLPDNYLRPYLGWGDITSQEYAGTSNYNSLQMKLERRTRRGLQYGLAYTLSKALGVESTEYDAVSGYFPARNWSYGPISMNRSQALVLNYSYDVPGLGKRLNVKPLGWVTDNWTLSGISTFVSGAPYMPGMGTTDGQDITGSSEGARITVIGQPSAGVNGLNPSAFARTPKGSFGNAMPGMLQGPGQNNWDVAIGKRFPFRSEGRYLQFRTEMFNAFNHTQYNGIDASFLFNPAGQQMNPTLGQYTSARSPRIIELSLRVMF